MSTNQYLTTAQQNPDADFKQNKKRSKSRGRQTKSKSKKQHNTSQLSEQEIDKKSLPDSDQLKKSTTATKPKQNNNNKPLANTQRQVKLNYFMRKKGQLSITTSTLMQNSTSSKYAVTEFQRKKSSLQKELKEKQLVIERLRNEKQSHVEKFARLKLQAEQYRLNTKDVLEKQLREYSKVRREEKAEINPKYGYYKQASWTIFVQGPFILKAKAKVQGMKTQIHQLQQKKRNSREKDRQLLTFQIQFLSKQLNEALTQLKHRQIQLTTYKQRMRLAEKQLTCTMSKSHWPLLSNRYLPLQLLGSGGFGQVYKAYDLDKNLNVAIKINCFQPTKSLEYKNQFIKHVERQVATLKQLDHPNIVKLMDEIIVDNKVSFVLEYCTGPELSKYLVKREQLEEKEARGIVKQLSFALKYMYEQKHRIIHYDLKPANIMFHNGCVKILDFGLCKKMQTEDTKIDLTSQGVGTYWYLPPETFREDAEISSKVDVWSLGVIFFQMLYGKRPFGHGVNQTKIYQDGIILKAIKVEFPGEKKYKVSDGAKEFIRECLKYSSEERLDPEQVYNHPYLNQ